MSLIFSLVNDWPPSALFGVACDVTVNLVGWGGFTDENCLDLALTLLFFLFLSLPLLLAEQFFNPQINSITHILNSVRYRLHIVYCLV